MEVVFVEQFSCYIHMCRCVLKLIAIFISIKEVMFLLAFVCLFFICKEQPWFSG